MQPSSIGPMVRALRVERGLTQRELATQSGLSPGAISQIETGVILPTVQTLSALADALGVRLVVQLEPHDVLPVVTSITRIWPHLSPIERAAIESLVQVLAARADAAAS